MVMSVMSYPAFVARPWTLVTTIVLAFLAPIVLEGTGVLPLTWEIRDGALISHAGALELGGSSSATMVVVASLATIVVAGIHAASIAKASRHAQHLLVTQAWHLRQLLPTRSVGS
jgi:hypothetical protein